MVQRWYGPRQCPPPLVMAVACAAVASTFRGTAWKASQVVTSPLVIHPRRAAANYHRMSSSPWTHGRPPLEIGALNRGQKRMPWRCNRCKPAGAMLPPRLACSPRCLPSSTPPPGGPSMSWWVHACDPRVWRWLGGQLKGELSKSRL